MSDPNKLVVEFEPNVLADIVLAAHLCEVEISGLAKVEREGRKFRVFDSALVLNQTCSLVKTEPDISSLNLWFNSVASTGDEEKIKDMERHKLWWHSHVYFEVIFSGQDFRTMKNILSGLDLWWLVLVVNKRNEHCLALIEKNGGFMRYEEAPLTLNPQITNKEFNELMGLKRSAMQQLIDERVIIEDTKKNGR